MGQDGWASRPAVEPRVLGKGRFALERLVGRGAVGDVYAARDLASGERLAIKVLRDLTSEGLLALKHEFRAIQGVHHPNLVRLSELFEEEGRLCLSMELVDGVPLRDYVRGHNDNGSDEERLRRAVTQLVSGLTALHAAGKVHRDVKSSNVLVDRRGRTVLLDFGLALEAAAVRRSTGALAGTVATMAPEQVLGEDVGPASDLYAVGVLMYECLTGRAPFTGAAHDLLDRKLAGAFTPFGDEAQRYPELAALCTELMAVDPRARPTGAAILERLHAFSPSSVIELTNTAPFVGRARELARLDAASQAARHAAQVVLVRGHSGVGKTCLVHHFADQLEQERDALVLRGRCYERESLPYKGLDAIVDALAAHLEELSDAEQNALTPADAELLCRAFPVLRGSLPERDAGDLGRLVPEQARSRTFQALRELLAALAQRERMVIVIDDVQWSDADSQALLRALLEPPHAPPVLWMLMFRTDVEHTMDLTLPGEPVELVVERLPDEDAELLARTLLGEAGARTPPRGLSSIVREAQGHPLFISELVRNLEHGQELVNLDEALWTRVERLDASELRVVEALSVAAGPIGSDLLAHATGLTPSALVHTRSQLEAKRLARSENAAGKPLLAPYHDRLRESVLAHLAPARRAKVHEQLARGMEQLGAKDADALAYHWEQAGEPERACPYLARAAEEAMAQLAFERAALALERLLTLRGGPDAAIEAQLAQAWSYAGHGKRAAAVRLRLAESLAAEERADQRRLAAEELLTSGRFDEGIRVLRAVIGEAGLPYPETPGKALFGLIGRRLQLRLRGTKLSPAHERERAARTLQTDAAASGCSGLMMVDAIRGNYFGIRSALCALELGDPVRAVRALVIEALAGGGADKRRSAKLLADVHALAAPLELPEVHAMLAVGDGGLGYFYGEWERGVKGLSRAEQLFRDHCVGVRYQLNSTRFMLYRSLAAAGQLPELRARLAPALRDAELRDDRYVLVNLHSTPLVLLALADDDPQEAEAHARRARTLLTDQGYHVQHYLCMLSEAQVRLYRGDALGALARVEEELPRVAKSLLDRVALIRVHCEDLRGRAALATAREAQGDARTKLERTVARCVSRLAREPDAWARAVGALLSAGLVTLRGEQSTGNAFEAAAQATRQSSMVLHAAAADLELARTRKDTEGAVRAHSVFTQAGVRDVDRFVRLFVPLGA